MSSTVETIEWLLEGDPSVRWQVLRDLKGESEKKAERERAKISREGWGARLLAKQGASGRWAGGKSSDGGMYSPKWISTTYTMLLLRDFGLSPKNRQAQKACKLLLDEGLRGDGGICFGKWAKWVDQGETCVTSMVLSILSYFQYDDARLEILANHLVQEQMSDGGWNCQRPRGATHSSMHTTILALEGLRYYELLGGNRALHVRAAQERGREFLLVHRLFRSHRTGNIIRPEFLKFSFPTRWHYDVLRALDYFQFVEAPTDSRLTDAIELLRSSQTEDGRWKLQNSHKGKMYFELERIGSASRWNTLRALRVLKWWGRG